MLERRDIAAPELSRLVAVLRVLSDYATLTKPPIIILLLLTALGGMFLASQGVPPLGLALLVCLGGAMGAGGANALNHYWDRDIDLKMTRTWQRPLPANRISPNNALSFGILLNVAAFLVLWSGVNLLAAVLTLAATLFYVFVYTMWLKRTTPQNIVIGGAAGSIPPMVGWVAVTGSLSIPAVYLFVIIFLWTPPHFWALALLIQKDYERAGVPMLPVVSSRKYTTSNIFVYSLVLVAATLGFALTQAVDWIYLGVALPLGIMFIALAWRLTREYSARYARHVYLYSLLYLGLLFGAMMVDSVVAL
jgi:protoheme IX farnesyltransferase